MDPARKLALEGTDGKPGGRCSAAFDQIGDRLGLNKIQLSVEECPLAELSGLGEPGSATKHAGEKQVRHHRSAVAVEFENIFAGERGGRGEIEDDPLVDDVAVLVPKADECCCPRGRKPADNRLRDGRGAGAGDADDGDTAYPRGGGERRNGAFGRQREKRRLRRLSLSAG